MMPHPFGDLDYRLHRTPRSEKGEDLDCARCDSLVDEDVRDSVKPLRILVEQVDKVDHPNQDPTTHDRPDEGVGVHEWTDELEYRDPHCGEPGRNDQSNPEKRNDEVEERVPLRTLLGREELDTSQAGEEVHGDEDGADDGAEQTEDREESELRAGDQT